MLIKFLGDFVADVDGQLVNPGDEVEVADERAVGLVESDLWEPTDAKKHRAAVHRLAAEQPPEPR